MDTLPVVPDPPEDIAALQHAVTPQSHKFAQYYALYDNAMQAARLAGYVVTHQSRHPYAMLRDPRISALVDYYRTVYAEASLYTPEKVLHQWALTASFPLTALLRDDWSIKRLDELPADVRAHLAVALTNLEVIEKGSLETGITRTIKPKFSKTEALEHLGRLLKLYEQEKGHGDGLTININVAAASQPTLQEQGVDVGPVQIRLHEGRSEG